ncbi:MAG: hypothetical protein HFG37_07435 [Eubacterium sp.]|nr:hypothetical protein [Eubacterium sp.]
MKNQILEKILQRTTGEEYDVAVMYSGGKDSAYLLYLLKEIYHLRVVAVTVDNGYENEYMWEKMKQFTKSRNVPLEIVRPGKELFQQLFHMLIVEKEYFAKEGINHICFICNNILWCCVSQYAAQNNIPFVASGLSLAQLSSGREKPLLPDKMANAIAEKSTKKIFYNALAGMEKSKCFCNSKKLKKFVLQLGENIKKVKTLYPYIYHTISVEDMKNTLSDLNWQPPRPIGIDRYISSGCKIMSEVIYELEKIGLITLNEREQAKSMVQNGLADEKELKFANYDASQDVVNLSGVLMEELDIKEYLLQICKCKNKEVIL